MTNDPIVYADDVMITMRGVSDSIGLPNTVNPLELVDREALIELREGPVGPVGPDGAPAWPWEWQGDIADTAALRALQLTTADARKAWRVLSENAVYFWTGLEFIAFANAFGRSGRPGKPNRLTGSGVAGAAGSSASAQISGPSPGQKVTITFPRGQTGPVGDPGAAGRIQDAVDVLVDRDHPLAQDHVLAWNVAAGKFVPIAHPRRTGPWAIAQAQFNGGANLVENEKTLAAITIPSQPVPWRPMVEGWVNAGNRGPRGRTQCDIEVRIGADGDVVGRGHGFSDPNFGGVMISPEFQYPLSAGSQLGVVAANQTITLHVIIKRIRGNDPYEVKTEDAHLIVYAQPV
ncbi:hypothetical protein NONI108955_36430 [Nocardia ninae]|uniref:Minor tail protein n=1 Tax=Nocardia ninae NBRC 108245 TaxID=1210091 RepID=A0A511MHF8_9NOCA|nr:hypothetical protein [Nocardia ninae]GEM39508.1 hypothetical protein NN4_40270 [Nocardia ninae NBRC 108245]